jgi:hypothetical protein
MKRPDPIFATIAREHLFIPILETRGADSLDFYNVAVWQVEAALKAAFDAGVWSTNKNAAPKGNMTAPAYSPAPWSYEYSPYRSRRGEDGIESELPAYEVFDADGGKVFDTNENSPGQLQEANACMGAAAPRLVASLVTCANLLADYDESDGPEGEAYREALAAVTEATGRPA